MKIYKKVSILSATVLLILSIQSCYKIKSKYHTIYGTVCCVDTNNVGISGIKYRIYETSATATGTIVTLSPQPHASVWLGFLKTNFEWRISVS